MTITAAELNSYLKGEVEGDAHVTVTAPAKIEDASEGHVTFLANKKYAKYANQTSASVMIVARDFEKPEHCQPTLIRVENPYTSFTQVLELFNRAGNEQTGIHERAVVAENATLGNSVFVGAATYIGENVELGENVKVFPNVYIESETKIGRDTVIHPGVIIYRKSEIGKNCILHGGTVIGSDGFGFAPQEDGSYKKIPQMGNVIVEDDVEIGANCSIDRATLGSTIIRQGVKLDNLIQVAHNVEIGKNTVIAAQTGISGSAKIGDQCVIGGQVGFVGHLEIADNSKFQAQTGVSRSITKKGQAWADTPAFESRQALRSQVIYRKLPDLQQRLEALENEIQKLQETKNNP